MKCELDEAMATLSRTPAALKAMLTYGNQKHLCSIDHNRGGAGPQPQNLFGALLDWVENGVAPDCELHRWRNDDYDKDRH